MNLRFKLLGVELFTLELNAPDAGPREVTPTAKAVKGLSNWWVRRMNS